MQYGSVLFPAGDVFFHSPPMSIKKLGRYELIRVLGKGAMGLVYEGRDPNLDRRVAIKTIKVENLSEEAAAEYEVRFRTEARSAARLQHPNIVSVYDSDRDGDIAFLVMEFIAGDDLKHHLDKGELYSLEQSLTIMTDLLSALDYAHRQSIVHRDIKPANLLIETSGRVKLTDFGVARIQDSGETTRTQGSIVGTLKYMSPEQVQGLPIDARADLFAAGIVLYQLLTGKRPFDGDTDFATIQQIVGHNPAPPSTFNTRLPAAMDGVVARALAKKRDQRYASAQEFSAALEAAAREAADPTVLPPAVEGGPGRQSTWTSTLLAGEALVGLQSGTSGGISTVTQEVELVYWKDIKESTDIEDIQGFLDKFPSGIYADLARRRLRKLGGGTGEDSDVRQRTGTLVVPRSAVASSGAAADPDGAWTALEQAARAVPAAAGSLAAANPPPAADDPDATRMGAPVARSPAVSEVDASAAVPESAEVAADISARDNEASPAAPAVTVGSADPAVNGPVTARDTPTPGSDTATPPSTASAGSRTPPAAAPSRRGIWVIAAVGMLVVGGAVFKLSAGSRPTASAPDAATVSPASPGGSPAPADNISAPPAAQTAAVASAAPAASAPANAASAAKAAALLAARKAALEKERASKAAAAKPSIDSAPERSAAAERSSNAAAAASPAATAGGPRQACEGRILIGFQICMAEQCAKPAFTNHPVCVERRAIEQRRREAEQIRN